MLIEIKRMRDGEGDSLESLAEAALRQIRERDYAHGLRGTTILYGMAFREKTPAVASEIIIDDETDQNSPSYLSES